jgi:hypothetical protein
MRRLLCGQPLVLPVHPAGERDDAVLDGHADLGLVDAHVVPQRLQDRILQAGIGRVQDHAVYACRFRATARRRRGGPSLRSDATKAAPAFAVL